MKKESKATETKKSIEIEDFIKTTLSSVFQAVTDSNYEDMSDARFTIYVGAGSGGRNRPVNNKIRFQMPSVVNFDIALTVAGSTSIKGGLDIKIAKLGSDLGGQHSTVSRVNFAIPVKKYDDDD